MELSEEQLKVAETQLKRYLPRSMMVYGLLMLRNRVQSDPMAVYVDQWPDFNILICKPQCEQKADLFKDILVFANAGNILEEIIRKSSIIDWSSQQTAEILKAVASEKGLPSGQLALCHMMILEDVSNLLDIDSSKISLGSLNESHISLVNQTWKFGESEISLSMIRNMAANFPSCCVLDAEGKPVAWILVYASCAMGMLYTLPEHRGKGYAKVLICSMAKRLHAEGYPVYCFIEEENTLSYRLFKNLGFTEDPSFRGEWLDFNEL